MKKNYQIFLSVFLIILIVIFLFIAILFLADLSKEFIVSVVTAIGGYFGFLYTARKTKEKEIEARLFPPKAGVYGDIFTLIKDLFVNNKKSNLSEKAQKRFEEELAKKLMEIKTNLLIWGSEDTISCYLDIDNSADVAKTDTYVYMNKWAKLYYNMRKDLGHKDKNLSPKDLMSIYLDEDAKQEYFDKG